MNVPIPVFVLFLFLVAFLFYYRPQLLFFLYPVAVMVLPTFRGMVGMPLYLFDVLAVPMLIIVFRRGGNDAWPRSVFPWPKAIIFLLVVFGTIVPFFRYGLHPEILWIACHAYLALIFLHVGSAFVTSPALKSHATFFLWGIIAALALLAVIATLERGSPAMSALFNGIYYRDLASTTGVFSNDPNGDFRAEMTSQRASAGFGSPNNLGQLVVLAAAWCWFFRGGRVGIVAWALGLLVVFDTISRQALIGALICLLGFGLLRGGRITVQAISGLAIVPVLLPLLFLVPQLDSWTERLGRLQQGADEANVSARLVDGPERLFLLIDQRVDVLALGVGMDVHKLVAKGIDVGILDSGFASNSFLLALYFFGIVGFLTFLAYWLACIWASLQLPRSLVAKAFPLALAGAFLFFVDNAGLVAEASMALFGLVAGSIFAHQGLVMQQRKQLKAGMVYRVREAVDA